MRGLSDLTIQHLGNEETIRTQLRMIKEYDRQLPMMCHQMLIGQLLIKYDSLLFNADQTIADQAGLPSSSDTLPNGDQTVDDPAGLSTSSDTLFNADQTIADQVGLSTSA